MCIKLKLNLKDIRFVQTFVCPTFRFILFLFFFPFQRFTISLSISPVDTRNKSIWETFDLACQLNLESDRRSRGLDTAAQTEGFFLSLMHQSVTRSHKVLAQLTCLLHYAVMLFGQPFFCHSCSAPHSAVLAFFQAQYIHVAIPGLVFPSLCTVLLPVCRYSRPVRSILCYQRLAVHHLKISTYSILISHHKFLLLVLKWSVSTAHPCPIDHSTGK